MSYRSEQNRIGNKQNYKDLNMTQYPNQLDTRTNNPNMKGFANVGEGQIPDYVMAEYVNALIDGVRGIQRTLGTTPMVPFDAASGTIPNLIENSTVKERISRIENGLFDERYGGSGWRNVANRPTLSNHSHTGTNGQPGKISLQTEIKDILQKSHLNTTLATGLTGADLFVSTQNPVRIHTAINDTLSKSTGGVVDGPVTFNAATKTRTQMDAVAEDIPRLANVSLVSDSNATSGRALRVTSSSTSQSILQLSAGEKRGFLFGKYVMAIRLRVNSAVASASVRIRLGSQSQTFTGAEIGGSYKQIYFVFDHTAASVSNPLIVEKLATTDSVSVTLDSFFIQPMHPAVLDR